MTSNGVRMWTSAKQAARRLFRQESQGQPLPHMARAALATLWRYRVVAALLLVVGVFAVEFYALKLPQANAAYTIANSAPLEASFLMGFISGWSG